MAAPDLAPEFVVARADDLEEVRSILTEAAAWARDRGVVGFWPVPYPAEWLLDAVARGDVYLVHVDGRPAATLTLQWADLPIWGEQPPVAGYVHRFAIRRHHGGKQLGSRMLAWAASIVAQRQRTLLRLDTRSTFARLRWYYLQHGFRIVGNSTVRDFEVVLFERRVAGPRSGPSAPARGR